MAIVMASKEESEINTIKKACNATVDVFSKYLKEQIMDIIDRDRKVCILVFTYLICFRYFPAMFFIHLLVHCSLYGSLSMLWIQGRSCILNHCNFHLLFLFYMFKSVECKVLDGTLVA